MAVLKNRAKMSTSTTGTGTITLGSAESGYQTFADAGVANADVVRYVIEDTGGAFEIGTGTYTATGTTLTRTVSESSNSDAAINLSGSATVFIGATAEDIPALYADNPSSATTPSATGTNAVSIGSNSTATGNAAVAIGQGDGDATGDYAFAVAGQATNTSAISIGTSSAANGFKSVSLGADSRASGTRGVAIGANAQAISGANATAIADSYASGTDSFAAAIGNNTSTYGATGANSVAIGAGLARATTSRAMAFGNNARAEGADSVAIGRSTDATASASFGFGYAVLASHANSLVFGTSASSSAINQITLGSTSDTVRISSAYTLPTADGTANQVLTTDGSGAVTFADAAGGASEYTIDNKTGAYTVVSGDLGKILNYTSGTVDVTLTALSSLTTGFHVSIWNSGTGVISIKPNSVDGIGVSAGNDYDSSDPLKLEMGTGVTLVNSGTYWQIYSEKAYDYYHHSVTLGANAKASNNYAMALGNRSSASSVGAIAIGTGQGHATTASNSHAVAIGLSTASGANSTALGTSFASGSHSFAAAIANNTSSYGASGSYSIAIGQNAKATGVRAYALGRNSIASSTGSYSIGDDTTASQLYAMAYGKKAKSDVQGKHAFGTFTVESSGAIQGGLHVLYVNTTDATAVALSTSNSAASTTNQVILPNNSAYSFSGTIIARENAAAGSDYASWEIKGALLRDANAASTVLGNGIQNKLYATSGASAWAIALSADTTNGGLKIEVTGAASTNIRWVATVNTSEVTYA